MDLYRKLYRFIINQELAEIILLLQTENSHIWLEASTPCFKERKSTDLLSLNYHPHFVLL